MQQNFQDLPFNYTDFASVRIDITGCEYSRELEQLLKEDLSFLSRVVTRGNHAPAAGPCLLIDIAVAVVRDIPSELLTAFILYLFKKTKDAIVKKMKYQAEIGTLTIETLGFDVQIVANCNTGMNADKIDYGALLQEIEQFAQDELRQNASVRKIVTPCAVYIDESTYPRVQYGSGSLGLWEVHYRDGEKWPSVLYDSINKAFIPFEQYGSMQTADQKSFIVAE